MKKKIIVSIILINTAIILILPIKILNINNIKSSNFEKKYKINNDISIPVAKYEREVFVLYVNNQRYKECCNIEEAISFGETMKNSSIKIKGKSSWIWDNYLPYNVFTDGDTYEEFETFKEAVDYGRLSERAFIYHHKDNSLIWSNVDFLKKSHKIKNVPNIKQQPELPRGCEVTSLCMLLNYKGIKSDKITLAKEIKKDLTPYEYKDGKIFCGNPNTGFVGSMTYLDSFGYGVYHKPIYELLAKYAPQNAIDLTGAKLEDLFYFICGDTPIWVIVNDKYKKLPESSFYTWHTPSGDIKVTYNEHSVLIIGYDSEYIYFNDPMGYEIKANRKDFEESFIQMGSQAVTLSN